MLSEKLNRYWDSEEPAATDPPEERQFWQLNRDTFLDVAKSYATQLLRETVLAKSLWNWCSTICPARAIWSKAAN